MTTTAHALAALLVASTLACGCHRGGSKHGHSHESATKGSKAGHRHGAGGATVSETRWSRRLELFVEFAPLVVGQSVRFTAHLTDLKSGAAITKGRVTAVLCAGSKHEARSKSVPISRPGIFTPTLTPRSAGSCALMFSLARSGDKPWRIGVEKASIYQSKAKAKAAFKEPEPPPGAISMRKEQQWPLALRTTSVRARRLRRSVTANAVIAARPDGQAHVSAPLSGRLVARGKHFIRIGMKVKRDQVLAAIVPRLGSAADPAAVRLEVTRARLQLSQARRTHARLAALLSRGAVARRRVLDAKTAVDHAQAELSAARRRSAQAYALQRVRKGRSAGQVALRAPLDGIIARVDVAPGAFVRVGQAVAHVVDLDTVWLKVRVAEADVGRVQNARGAWFEIDGFAKPFVATPKSGARVIALGGVLDKRSRTVPLIIELPNAKHRLRIGLFARAHVLTGKARMALAVPRSAIVDDGGQSVAYVQVGGETFVRRPLVLGLRDGAEVEVKSGLRAGEHVVVQGAYNVRLAASGKQVPGHGHEH